MGSRCTTLAGGNSGCIPFLKRQWGWSGNLAYELEVDLPPSDLILIDGYKFCFIDRL
jgi:hypothetical protein